jgi:hypothetical protein
MLKDGTMEIDGHCVSIVPENFSFRVKIDDSEFTVFCKDDSHGFAIARIFPAPSKDNYLETIQAALDIFRKKNNEEMYRNIKATVRTEKDLLNSPESRFVFYDISGIRVGLFLTSVDGPTTACVVSIGQHRFFMYTESFYDRNNPPSQRYTECFYISGMHGENNLVPDEKTKNLIVQAIERYALSNEPPALIEFR